jgi:hypothetical protein
MTQDPDTVRCAAYRQLQASDETHEALWEAIETLQASGVDVGKKADSVLSKRREIKRGIPK